MIRIVPLALLFFTTPVNSSLECGMQITDRMAYSLPLPLATTLAFRIISPVNDGLLKRIRNSQEDKPISLFDELNIEQVKKLRKVLDWAIERMELDIATGARLGPPGCVEDMWPAGEYGKHSKKIKEINAKHGMGELVLPASAQDIEREVPFNEMLEILATAEKPPRPDPSVPFKFR